MNIIAKGTIDYYVNRYPKAKTALLTWHKEFSKKNFKNFNELKETYGYASIVGNSRVVFNIKANDYRLIVKVHFVKQAAYVIWFGPHADYNLVDVATIAFDTKILDFKNK
jgi:mRNA interferase HigB